MNSANILRTLNTLYYENPQPVIYINTQLQIRHQNKVYLTYFDVQYLLEDVEVIYPYFCEIIELLRYQCLHMSLSVRSTFPYQFTNILERLVRSKDKEAETYVSLPYIKNPRVTDPRDINFSNVSERYKQDNNKRPRYTDLRRMMLYAGNETGISVLYQRIYDNVERVRCYLLSDRAQLRCIQVLKDHLTENVSLYRLLARYRTFLRGMLHQRLIGYRIRASRRALQGGLLRYWYASGRLQRELYDLQRSYMRLVNKHVTYKICATRRRALLTWLALRRASQVYTVTGVTETRYRLRRRAAMFMVAGIKKRSIQDYLLLARANGLLAQQVSGFNMRVRRLYYLAYSYNALSYSLVEASLGPQMAHTRRDTLQNHQRSKLPAYEQTVAANYPNSTYQDEKIGQVRVADTKAMLVTYAMRLRQGVLLRKIRLQSVVLIARLNAVIFSPYWKALHALHLIVYLLQLKVRRIAALIALYQGQVRFLGLLCQRTSIRLRHGQGKCVLRVITMKQRLYLLVRRRMLVRLYMTMKNTKITERSLTVSYLVVEGRRLPHYRVKGALEKDIAYIISRLRTALERLHITAEKHSIFKKYFGEIISFCQDLYTLEDFQRHACEIQDVDVFMVVFCRYAGKYFTLKNQLIRQLSVAIMALVVVGATFDAAQGLCFPAVCYNSHLLYRGL